MEGKNLNKEKEIYYFKNEDIYNWKFKNDKKEGKGIIYYKNGEREMGNYLNEQKSKKIYKV